jgi:hypothetical protein
MEAMGEEVSLSPESRLWYVTLGQFSIIRLERDTQLVIPVYDYCFPEKECEGGTDDDPCTIFGRIRFPVEEFFPVDRPDGWRPQNRRVMERSLGSFSSCKRL